MREYTPELRFGPMPFRQRVDKSPLVCQILKGIRSIHTVPEKRAHTLELAVLQQIDQRLDTAISNAQLSGDQPASLRHMRNRSLMCRCNISPPRG